MLKTLPGYDPDVAKNRAEAQIMEGLGYGPDKRIAFKVSIRNIAPIRDPAVILIDQLAKGSALDIPAGYEVRSQKPEWCWCTRSGAG